MSKTTRFFILRLTGAQFTLIIAALVQSTLPGAKELATQLLDRGIK